MCIYYSCRINPWHRLQYLEPNIQIILMSAVIFALNSHSSPQWHIYCFHLWHINTLHFIYFSFLFTREKKEADFNPWYQPLHFWQDPNPRSKSPSPDHHSRPPKKQLIHSDQHIMDIASTPSHRQQKVSVLVHHQISKSSAFSMNCFKIQSCSMLFHFPLLHQQVWQWWVNFSWIIGDKQWRREERKKKKAFFYFWKTFRRIILEELMERNYFLYTVLSD